MHSMHAMHSLITFITRDEQARNKEDLIRKLMNKFASELFALSSGELKELEASRGAADLSKLGVRSNSLC
jgi:hypothetical protein